MDDWAVQVLGILEVDGSAHAAHEACMAKLRREGVIR
jgi:hypothetical protein